MAAIVAWIVLFVGGGLLHISDANTTHKIDAAAKAGEARVARIHNAEACTLRVLLNGLRTRALNASNDQAAGRESRKRARNSLPQYKFLLDGQITQPTNLNCAKFLKTLSKPVSKVVVK